MTRQLQEAFAQLADLPEKLQIVAAEAILCNIYERRQLEDFDSSERELLQPRRLMPADADMI